MNNAVTKKKQELVIPKIFDILVVALNKLEP